MRISSNAALAVHVLVERSANDGVAAITQMVPRFVVLAFLLVTDFATSATAQLEVEDQPERYRFLRSSFQSFI